MERGSRFLTADAGPDDDGGPKKRWESEIAFGPYRNPVVDEKYNPEDLSSHGLLPIRKYGPAPQKKE